MRMRNKPSQPGRLGGAFGGGGVGVGLGGSFGGSLGGGAGLGLGGSGLGLGGGLGRSNRPFIDVKLITGVLGLLILFFGVMLLLPAAVALLYGEASFSAFLITAMPAMAAGAGLFFLFRPRDELRPREAFLIVSLTWLVGSLIGAVPFMVSGALPATFTGFTDAVFETMSGLTTTGATIFQVMPEAVHGSAAATHATGTTSHIVTSTASHIATSTAAATHASGVTTTLTSPITPLIEDLDKSLLFWRSLTHWIGGMGIIILSLALLPLLGVGGMQLYQAEYSGSKRDKLTPRVQKTAMLLWTVYAGLTAAQFLLLWVHPSMDWFDALNHAFSTLATGGFSTRNGSLADYSSAYIDGITTLFMFLAGINFALHYRLFTGHARDFLSHRELRFYTLLIAISIFIVTLGLWGFDNYSLADALRYGSFQVVSIITTTGFGTDDYALWSSFAAFFLFLLFFTGGMAGSTGGGVKTIRILIVLKNAGREFKQLMHPKAALPVRLGDKAIDPSILKSILSFAVVYVIIFFLGALGMSLMGYDLLSSMGASIASLGNVGPGWGDFGPSESYAHVPAGGKWLLLMLMLIGRLELFTILVIFTPVFWKR